MSETTTTEESGSNAFAFDPESLLRYRIAADAQLKQLRAYIAAPQKNALTNLRIQQGQRTIGTTFGGQMQNLLTNVQQGGFGGLGNPLFVSQAAKIGRARSGASAQNQIQNRMFGEQLRKWATQALGGIQPLTTGGSFKRKGRTKTKKSAGLIAADIAGSVLPMAAAFIPGMGGMGGGGGMSMPQGPVPQGSFGGGNPLLGGTPYKGLNV